MATVRYGVQKDLAFAYQGWRLEKLMVLVSKAILVRPLTLLTRATDWRN